MNAHYQNKLVNSGLIERHNSLNAKFVKDESIKKSIDTKYIYLMTGYFPNYNKPLTKIGISNDPVRRLYGDGGGLANYISAGCAFPIFVDFAFETVFARDIERRMHDLHGDNRVYNPDVFSGKTEWFIGLDQALLQKQIIEFYESIQKKVQRNNWIPSYIDEYCNYVNDFKIDSYGIWDWFFESSNISEDIRKHEWEQKMVEMRKNLKPQNQ